MDSAHSRRPLRSPYPPPSPDRRNAGSRQSQHSVTSNDSATSEASSIAPTPAPLNIPKRPNQLPTFVSAKSRANLSSTNLNASASTSQLRPSAQYMPANDGAASGRKSSSPHLGLGLVGGHRRQHSQGYFELTMPSTSMANQSSSNLSSAGLGVHGLGNNHNGNNAGLTPSQIAAQAAMQHLNVSGQHIRRRSSTVPINEQDAAAGGRRGSYGSVSSGGSSMSPGPGPDHHHFHAGQQQYPTHQHTQYSQQHAPQYVQQNHLQTQMTYKNGLVGDKAATTAAAAVWKPPLNAASSSSGAAQVEEKEKSNKGLRRFRPKNIGIMRDKDKEAKEKPLPSPNKLPTSGLAKVYNASSASLIDSLTFNQGGGAAGNMPGNASMYNLSGLGNQSSSTIIPLKTDEDTGKTKSSKHVGLRQKLKLKDKDEHSLPLSSANSNSRPVDINNPQSLYNFAPSSPNHQSTFAKSVSGLDLRKHREKKKEEKEKEKALEQVYSRGESEASGEWPGLQSLSTSLTNASEGFTPYSKEMKETLAGFGLNNMIPEDAWEFLRAKLLLLFAGEDVRIAVEDLNRLVTIRVQRCVMQRDPTSIVDSLESLFNTGFASLNHTLRGVTNDERLVPNLVDLWMSVFGTILPFMQAVFLPLDQEFKGRGSILKTPALAAEFWGALPNPEVSANLSSSPRSNSTNDTDASSSAGVSDTPAGEELEVRRILLTSFRDKVILPRFDVLKATFSRLSLESINATLAHYESTGRLRGDSLGSMLERDRPSTRGAQEDPRMLSTSYSSQTSTLLNSNTPSTNPSALTSGLAPVTANAGGLSSPYPRSRATSNLSANSNHSARSNTTSHSHTTSTSAAQSIAFRTFTSPPTARATDPSSAQVTETVARMLQRLLVLASIQTGDRAQSDMEELTRLVKLNWLGRGRTGRNRRGWVGARVGAGAAAAGTLANLGRTGGSANALGEVLGSSSGFGKSENRKSVASTIRGRDQNGFGGSLAGSASLASAFREREGSREGSPTPTPTRQGTVSRQGERDRDQ